MVLRVVSEILFLGHFISFLLDVGQSQIVLLGLGWRLGVRVPILTLVEHIEAFFGFPLGLLSGLLNCSCFDFVRERKRGLQVVLAVCVVIFRV